MRSCYHRHDPCIALRTEYKIHVSLRIVAANRSSTSIADIDCRKIRMVEALAWCRDPNWAACGDGGNYAD